VTRLVTVLVTLAVPDEADAEDAAALVEDAATATALDVIAATGVEGYLPLPGALVQRRPGGQPWLVQSLHPGSAVLRDLGGDLVREPLTALTPDQLGVTRLR
jgi:hypothetical protein